MNPSKWTDQQIISGIKNANTRDQTLYALFYQLDWRGAAIALVRKLGGNEQDGEELASDAFIAFDHNLRNDRFQGKSTLKTYFLSIARYRWLNRLRQQRPDLLPLAETQEGRDAEDAEMIFLKAEYSEVFKSALALIGERCQKILELYMLDTRMEEIARTMDLANADMAKKAAYRCRMTMREFLESHPAWLERLRDGLRGN
jgi:RNA polymerase sigma-70 factor (ECF subfamily)